MADNSISLSGYTALPSAGVEYFRNGSVRAVRITGPFDVRRQYAVIHINDGWLIQGEDGYMNGLEVADFAAQFDIATNAITASAGANGSITPTGAVAVDYGANQVFTVTADPTFELEELLVDGVPAALTGDTYTFINVTAAHTIAAAFMLS